MTISSADTTTNSTLLRLLKLGFVLGGVISLAVGTWMVTSPSGWYSLFPGGIKDFGPLNAHFVRDLGGWYLADGVLLLFAFTNPKRFGGVALVVSLLSQAIHAGAHLADVITGRVGVKHLIIDAPGVFLPLLIYAVLAWILWNLQTSTERSFEPPEELS